MTDRQQIQLVKSDRQLTIELLTTFATLAVIYCALNPGLMRDVNQWVDVRVSKLRHRISIWAAREAIKSLPETHNRDQM